MATFVKFYSFPEAMAEEKHNFASDTLKWSLSATAPVITDAVYADLSGDELATSGGYTNGGATLTSVTSTSSSGLWTLGAADTTWTGSGGGFSFRYAILRNSSAPSEELIGYLDFGYLITVTSGQTVTIDIDATNGILYMS